MTEWDVRYESSAFKTNLEAISAALDALPEEENQDAQQVIARSKKVIAHAQAVASELDPELVSQSMLNGAGERTGLIKTEIETYASDRDPTHLENVKTQTDNLLDTLASWSFIPVKEVEGLGETISTFRRSAGQLMRNIQKDDSATRQKLEEVKTEGETIREAVKNEGDEARQAISAEAEAVRAKLTELEGQIGAEKQRLDSVFGEFDTESKTARKKLEDDAAQTLRDQLGEAKKQSDSINERGKALIGEIEKIKADAQLAAGVIGVTGLTEGFMKYADAQKETANKWNWLVILPLVIVAGIATWIIIDHKNADTLSLRSYIARFVISVPLLAVAGYAAQQSSKHRANERHSRKLQLELSSLNSFVEPLQPQDALEIKKSVADRIFGHPDADVPIDKVGAGQLADMLGKLIEALAKKI